MYPQTALPALTPKVVKQLKVSTILLFVIGGLSIATGVWFVADDFPFTGPADRSGKMGLTKAEIESRTNPYVVKSILHAWDQVGWLSISYGAFVIALAYFGIRRGQPFAWAGLIIGMSPAQIGGPIELRYNLETGDAGGGDVLVWLVLALFIVAVTLPAKYMIAALRSSSMPHKP
jgi:hypothetical protein